MSSIESSKSGVTVPTELWVAPTIVAVAWWGLLSASYGADMPPESRANLVFIGGPVLLLAGIHARLDGYLHDRARLRGLVLPVPAAGHWRAAAPRRRLGAALTFLLGSLAVGAAPFTAGADRPLTGAFWSLADWTLFWSVSLLVEPLVAGLAAYLGRRFEEEHPAHRIQRAAGGGWTTPEAVIHLYAPALGIGLAALLAMPGQLSMGRLASGNALEPVHLAAGLVPLVAALGIRTTARRPYEVGLWEAVPWLHETTRTLAGPPMPEETPSWTRLLGRSASAQLLAVQFARLTTLPVFRLFLLVGIAAMLLFRSVPPTPGLWGLGLCVAGLWLLPIRTLVHQRRVRAQLCAALPLPASARSGGIHGVLPALLMPPLALGMALLLRWGMWA